MKERHASERRQGLDLTGLYAICATDMINDQTKAEPKETAAARIDVVAARRRIAHVTRNTPVIESELLNAKVGRRVLLKAENLQVGGSYKFRGAYNRLSQLDQSERSRGAVAWSSGNHGIAVAIAARRIGATAIVVAPFDAPSNKLERMRAEGAWIVPYDRRTQDRERIARAIVQETHAILVPSFDDPEIIAGQGTVVMELLEQARELSAELNVILVPCGGGGLAAGSVLAVRSAESRSLVYAVEPDGFDDTALSLRAGRRVTIDLANRSSICDALLVKSPGQLTFSINQGGLAGALSCSDQDVRTAVKFAFDELKLVLEPSGAVGLAALLAGRAPGGSTTVGIVLTGGGVDPSAYGDLIMADALERTVSSERPLATA